MSCYFRHMKDVFDEAGIEITPENKKEVDKKIHHMVDIDYKNCPETWKKVKLEISDDKKRAKFISKLKKIK
ncbi:MAG: hypothetical protein JW738_05110 [Actinobacteria bacterium]|nr:hypothetical protein [Actinomycetota bacterium]